MNFSNTIKYSGICEYSPNGNFLAIAKGLSLIIYVTVDLKIFQKFSFSTQISQISWSPDNTLILVAFFKTGIVEIKSLSNQEWNCSINESQSGVTFARWTPDSRKIIIINDFHVRLSIWSLVDKSTIYLNNPKFHDKGITFSSSGCFMALAERKEGRDYIGIYFTGDWSLVSYFATDTYDLNDIVWSKDDTSIVAWDSDLECKIAVYSPTGNLVALHEPYTGALGISSAKYSPNGIYFAAGFNDNNIRIYNHKIWKLSSCLNHNITTISAESMVNVFREEEINGKKKFSKYVECNLPYKMNLGNNNSIIKGIGGAVNEMEWSYDSNYIASKSESVPNVIFIWQVNSLRLFTMIVQLKSIKDFKWSPNENMLLIVTENAKMYTFTLSNVYIVELVSDLKNNFGAIKVNWNSDGKSFIVSDKKEMIIGYPEIGEINNDGQNFEEEQVEEEDKKGIEEERNEIEDIPEEDTK